MTEYSFDYVAAQKTLDIGDRADAKALATVAKVHAQATVDIAASLAMIVELMQAAQEVHDALPEPIVVSRPEPEPEPEEREDASEAEPGDMVAVRIPEGFNGLSVKQEVLEVGTTEGEVWLKLDGIKGKKWARDYVIVERGVGGDFDE